MVISFNNFPNRQRTVTAAQNIKLHFYTLYTFTRKPKEYAEISAHSWFYLVKHCIDVSLKLVIGVVIEDVIFHISVKRIIIRLEDLHYKDVAIVVLPQ